MDYKEFEKALVDFKLDLEENDIQTIFGSFDKNKDGVISLPEFFNTILGQLNPARLQVVD